MNLWGLWGGGGGSARAHPSTPSLLACCMLLVCFSPIILAVRARALEWRGGGGCGCAYKNREHKLRDGRRFRSVKIVVS